MLLKIKRKISIFIFNFVSVMKIKQFQEIKPIQTIFTIFLELKTTKNQLDKISNHF